MKDGKERILIGDERFSTEGVRLMGKEFENRVSVLPETVSKLKSFQESAEFLPKVVELATETRDLEKVVELLNENAPLTWSPNDCPFSMCGSSRLNI